MTPRIKCAVTVFPYNSGSEVLRGVVGPSAMMPVPKSAVKIGSAISGCVAWVMLTSLSSRNEIKLIWRCE